MANPFAPGMESVLVGLVRNVVTPLRGSQLVAVTSRDLTVSASDRP